MLPAQQECGTGGPVIGGIACVVQPWNSLLLRDPPSLFRDLGERDGFQDKKSRTGHIVTDLDFVSLFGCFRYCFVWKCCLAGLGGVTLPDKGFLLPVRAQPALFPTCHS